MARTQLLQPPSASSQGEHQQGAGLEAEELRRTRHYGMKGRIPSGELTAVSNVHPLKTSNYLFERQRDEQMDRQRKQWVPFHWITP